MCGLNAKSNSYVCAGQGATYAACMKKTKDFFELSATDLVGHLNCHHLTDLDRAVAEGALAKPKVWDPLLKILAERGAAHEQSYIEHLTKAGFEVVRIDGVEVTDEAVPQHSPPCASGVPVIVQGALAHKGWIGRADILRRVEGVRARLAAGLMRRSTRSSRAKRKPERSCSFASTPIC